MSATQLDLLAAMERRQAGQDLVTAHADSLYRERLSTAIKVLASGGAAIEGVTLPAYPRVFINFWARVLRPEDGCWTYQGHRDHKGYGKAAITLNGRKHSRAHRAAYEMLVGPIPEGLQLDHLCRNRSCVNPSHLEPVTNQENGYRGQAPGIVIHLAGEACAKGHRYVEGSFSILKTGGRRCLICQRARYKAWYDRQATGELANHSLNARATWRIYRQRQVAT